MNQLQLIGHIRWYNAYNDKQVMTRTLQQLWGRKNGWAWSQLEWRDVPEVFE